MTVNRLKGYCQWQQGAQRVTVSDSKVLNVRVRVRVSVSVRVKVRVRVRVRVRARVRVRPLGCLTSYCQ